MSTVLVPHRDPREQYSLSAREAAAYLTLPIKALYRLVGRGEIDHRRMTDSVITRTVNGVPRQVRNCGQIRFSLAGLDAWEESCRKRVSAPRATSGAVKPRIVISDVVMPKVRAFR